MKPLVSVILCTKNASSNLGTCLSSLNKQTFRNFETVVVDNKSTDDTKTIARKFGAKVFDKGPERAAQKNFGADKAQGKYLLFVDTDMELAPEVISQCLEKIKTADAITIPEVSLGEGFWNECVILERSCYHAGDIHTEGIRFLTKTLFFRLGGFDETLVASGEDLDISQRCRRQGYKIDRITADIFHHEAERTPYTTYKKWRYYGRNMGKYILKNKQEALYQYLPIRPAWAKNWRKLLADPIHTLGFMYLKVCQLAGVLLGQIDAIRASKQMSYNPYAK